MIKEIKYKGLSTTPSDYECEDGHLAAAENIINDSRMIEVPNGISNGILFKVADGYEPIVIHTVANKKLLICWDSSTGAASSGKLGYIDMDSVQSASSTQTPTTISTSQVYSTKPTAITPIGKTIIVNSEAGTHFYLYSGASYNFLGSHLPEIELQFGLNIYHSQTNHDPVLLEPIDVTKSENNSPVTVENFTNHYVSALINKQENFYYTIQGGYGRVFYIDDASTSGALTSSENLLKNAVQSRRNNWFDACHKYNSFHHPFMVRYCYKLYDGSRVMFSSPVLMVPAVKNPIFIPEDEGQVDGNNIKNEMRYNGSDTLHLKANGLRLNGLYRTGDLMAKLKSSLSGFDQWKDIIASVEIYVSNYIETEKPGAENIMIKHMGGESAVWKLDKEYSIGEINNSTGMLRTNPSDESKSFNTRYTSHLKHQRLSAFEIWHASANNNNVNAWGFGNDASTQANVNPYSPYMIAADDYASNDINRQVKNASFYLFKEYNISELSDNWMYVKDGVEDSYLKNLTARRAMDLTYDYQSHDTRFTKVCMSYNNSYVTANNVYTKFKGFRPSTMFQFAHPIEYDVFTNTEHTLSKLYDSYTKITTNQGDIVVKKAEDNSGHGIPVGGELNTYHIYPFIISYPDTQAVAMYLQDTEMPANNKFKFDLISNSIGTKFYFTGFFPSSIPVTGESIPAETPLQTTSNPNEVAISRQSNMFAYADTGINLVGNGEVRAVAVNTHALSQGQFGQYPIYVFTSDGIWVLEIDNAGIVQTISPLTRDVITSDENGLGHVAQTDNTLLFPTKQGLMAIRGASVELQSLNFFDDAKDILANVPFNSVPFLAGKSIQNFNSFISNMRASFDYENKRIIVFSADYDNIMYAWKNENSATDVIFSKYEKPSVGEQMYNRQEEAIQGKIVTSYTHATTSYIMCGTTKYEKFDMGNFESSKKRPIYPYAFVKSINNDLWTIIPSSIIETLNSYPEALVITGDNKIIDLSKISPDITSNTANTGWFLTRPISLGDPNMPKVIDYVKQNGVFSNYRTMTNPEINRLSTLYAWVESGTYIYTKSSTPSHGDATYDSNGNVYPNRIVDAYTEGDPSIDVLEPEREIYTWDRNEDGDIIQEAQNHDVVVYARDNNAFVSDSIQQVLFGSNDLVNWVVISSSRSHRISDYSGSPYKWFRLAVKCSLKPGESLSSVTFSFRNKFSNDKLL